MPGLALKWFIFQQDWSTPASIVGVTRLVGKKDIGELIGVKEMAGLAGLRDRSRLTGSKSSGGLVGVKDRSALIGSL